MSLSHRIKPLNEVFCAEDMMATFLLCTSLSGSGKTKRQYAVPFFDMVKWLRGTVA